MIKGMKGSTDYKTLAPKLTAGYLADRI